MARISVRFPKMAVLVVTQKLISVTWCLKTDSHHTTQPSTFTDIAAWMLRQSVVKGLSQASRPKGGVLRDLKTSSTRSFVSSTYASASSPSPHDAFASGNNAYYADEMYKRWREDPKSVHASWDVYFSGLDKGLHSSQAFQPAPGQGHLPAAADGAPSLHAGSGQDLSDHLKVCALSITGLMTYLKFAPLRFNS